MSVHLTTTTRRSQKKEHIKQSHLNARTTDVPRWPQRNTVSVPDLVERTANPSLRPHRPHHNVVQRRPTDYHCLDPNRTLATVNGSPQRFSRSPEESVR